MNGDQYTPVLCEIFHELRSHAAVQALAKSTFRMGARESGELCRALANSP